MSQALFGQLMFGGFFALFAVIVLRVLRRGARGGAHDPGRSDDHALSSRADACDGGGWSFFGGACGGGGDSGGGDGGGD